MLYAAHEQVLSDTITVSRDYDKSHTCRNLLAAMNIYFPGTLIK